MDFEVLDVFSWREALIAIVALLALYVAVVFIRLRRLKQKKADSSEAASSAAHSAVAAYAAVQEPVLSDLPELSESLATTFPWNEPPPGVPSQPIVEALEREVAQLRKEVGGLRAEVLLLREQQRELPKPQMTQNVSPLYNDAMQMALQGRDAVTISQHCGISRAEAELVVALVRNQDSSNQD